MSASHDLADLERQIAAFEARHPRLSAASYWARRDAVLDADLAQFFDWERRDWGRQHWRAAWMLATTRQDDLAPPWGGLWQSLLIKILCVMALCLGRSSRSRTGGYYLRHPLCCGTWDAADDRRAWWRLEFSWREFRYELERESEEVSYG